MHTHTTPPWLLRLHHVARRPRTLVMLLLCCVFAVRVLSGLTFIHAGIENAETYAGICLAADPHCVVTAPSQVQLEDTPSCALNLSLHLLSGPALPLDTSVVLARLPQVLHARALQLLLQVFPASIFHPPKSAAHPTSLVLIF